MLKTQGEVEGMKDTIIELIKAKKELEEKRQQEKLEFEEKNLQERMAWWKQMHQSKRCKEEMETCMLQLEEY